MSEETTTAESTDPKAAIEAWYREFFCDRQSPYLTEAQNEIRAAVDELKNRFA